MLSLSRNIFFYKVLLLPDKYETRINLIFFHFSIMMIVTKMKGEKFDQVSYDNLFISLENNLRELGFGDVAVNTKMKYLNKTLYDILLKLKLTKKEKKIFDINQEVVIKYFPDLKKPKNDTYLMFKNYLQNFFKFCFEVPPKNMIRDVIKFKN